MKTRLRIDVDYDPTVTDPESLASAMDRMLETISSTPGIWDDYANPALGEFFVAEPERPVRPTVEVPAYAALVSMCDRVAETADNWADCSDMKEALAVFKELGQDCRKLLDAQPATPCECEEPGYFCSGVPGILAHRENGKLAPDTKVERCDLCQRYPTDDAARQKLIEREGTSSAPKDSRYVLYDLDTDALASTTIYDDYREAVDDASAVNDVIVVPLLHSKR